MPVIAVANNKGGVSKTTTACNVAYCMAQRGEKVLLIDMDSQGNATRTYGVSPEQYSVGMYHLLLDQIRMMLLDKPKYSIRKAVLKTSYGLDLIPCDSRVSEISTWLQDHAAVFNGADLQRYWQKEFPFFLLKILDEVRGKYTRIIIDTPPAFEYNTKASLIASDHIIIPVELGDLELTGLESLFKKIVGFKKDYDRDVSVLGIIVNRYDWGKKGGRTVVERALEEQLREHPVFGKYVCQNIIYRNTSIREAAVLGKLAATYEKKNARSARENFDEFVEEIEIRLAREEAAASGD
ncbi:MAG TPA: ParA family protein [Spirochaetia bacterium]|nr:ParA family protein [Spirochaetia bacterium]